ncbi:rhophilin-2-like [Scyliorhinus canicula]|uniref:rhophilin-2-like n=1 Tax=Scyliorhinus canicula TaxID=7830 RepID=UPI0018F357F3|nr:rhophilin-2-like [Scyliorhinus canicula]
MTETLRTAGHPVSPARESGRFRKGCNPYAQTGRSKLQSQRVSLNQQIIKAMRLRAGAENLLRATDNSKVRDMVMLELCFVNSNLQLLKEELEGLNGSVEVYQNENNIRERPGVLSHLKESFTHTPSFDMSPSMQNMLIRLMLAQAQECAFEKMVLPGIRNQYFSLLKVAQESAKVSDVYNLINQSITQAPIKEHVPPAWFYTAQVKLEHYRALAHYFVAVAMLDHQLNSQDDVDQQEMLLSQLYDVMPDGLAPLSILRSKEERKRVGKAHLRKAVMGHEEAVRVQNLCRSLRKIEILQEILRVSHKRSLTKYAEHEQEDDFDMMIAPNIIAKSDQKIEIVKPDFSKVKVVDFFHDLGPISVFSAKQKWTAPRKICLMPGDQDQGFTLQGESAVQVTSLDPSSHAARSGLRDGDIIVSVAGRDCKWNSVTEVIKMLKEMPENGLDIQVISPQGLETVQLPKCATYSGGLPKTYSLTCLTLDDVQSRKGKKVVKKLSFLNWGNKNTKKMASTISLPSAVESRPQLSESTAHFPNALDGSSLY